MNSHPIFKAKMSVDIPRDLSLAAIIILPLLMLLIQIPLSFLSFYSSIFGILVYIAWYLACIAIILQDRTTVEIEQNTIRINRFLFGPWIINRNEIIKTDVRKHIYYRYRVLWYTFMIAMLVYLVSGIYYHIQKDIMNNYPATEVFFLFLSSSLAIVFFCSLFINAEKRLRFPFILQVTTDYGKYKFYTREPDEFKKLIDKQYTEE